MKLKKLIIIVILIVFTIYFGFQVKFHYKINGDYTIIQTENTQDNNLPNYINQKYPIVINKTLEKDSALSNLSIDVLQQLCKGKFALFNIQNDPNEFLNPSLVNIDAIPSFISNNNRWKCILNHRFLKNYQMFNEINDVLNPVLPKLTLKTKINLIASSKNYIEPLQYFHDYKTVLLQLSGTKIVRLFSPKMANLLYLDDKYNPLYNNSKINIWENHDKLYKKFPKLKETEFIDIILRPGNTLIIPNYWLFSTKNIDNNVTVMGNVNTIFSYFINIPNNMLNIAHEIGVYKNNKCYCHN